jgi:ABC-type glycerol-3-phosphate transport system substrate-binding protein
MRTRTTALVGGLALLTTVSFGCGNDSEGTEPPAEGATSGSITVLTNRTDLVDTTFVEYAERFNEQHPDIEVNFEAMTDYEGEVRIRMNTADYGDVLLIPNAVTPSELENFFEPLGTVEELGKKYRFINEQAYDGNVYGLATFGNANGIVYNQRVFEEAGITSWATTSQEFIADLQAVKENTDAIPYYTNYADGWPLTMWEQHRGSISADPDYVAELAHLDEPWAVGADHYVIDSLIHDIVANELAEPDPTTTDWERSKELLARGEIASMALGSWAVIQMQEAAESPDDIAFMPFPSVTDGEHHTTIAGDWKIAINKNSANKAAARVWLDWFLNESGFYDDSGSISPLIEDPLPEQLQAFEAEGVVMLEQNPAPEDEQGLTNDIDNASEIGLGQPEYRQRIIDAARGASGESLDEIFTDLNERWTAAKNDLGG